MTISETLENLQIGSVQSGSSMSLADHLIKFLQKITYKNQQTDLLMQWLPLQFGGAKEGFLCVFLN